jgi:predicted HTH transcriptional regulator
LIYASEIIEAVQKGGLSNWATTTGRNSKQSMFTKRKAEAEEYIEELYSAMYGGKFTATQLQRMTGQSKDSVYSRLSTLMERGKVKRSKVDGKNYKYWRT